MNRQTLWRNAMTAKASPTETSDRAYRGTAMANDTPAELVWEPWAIDARMFAAANTLIVAFALFLLLLTFEYFW